MTPEQIKIELQDMIDNYDMELWADPPEEFTIENYPDHLRKTFITGIRTLIEHI